MCTIPIAWKAFFCCLFVHSFALAGFQYPGARQNNDLLKGAIDLHIHSAPDAFDRSVNDIEVARFASAKGMQAVVIKNHLASTAGRAELTNSLSMETKVYGGIVLNREVGGINPHAVEAMCRISPAYGKVVWFPTMDAAYHMEKFGIKGNGLRILESGKLTAETIKVLELIAAHQLVLATGHISPEEIFALAKQARQMGIRQFLVTHPLADSPGLNLSQMQELATLGAIFELTFLSYLSGPQSHLPFLRANKHVSVQEMAQTIKKLGADHFVLTTDLGQPGNPIPGDGLKVFAEMLLNNGISAAEIETMIKRNPARLLGIK
jgi:hypothetical protein